MKKLIIAVAVAAGALGAFAGPHHRGPGRGPGGFHRSPPFAMRPTCGVHRPPPPAMRPMCGFHRPPPPRPFRRHHGGVWGPGGRNFWPGFVGGVIGGVVTRAIVDPAPVVVTTPAVVRTTVVSEPVSEVRNVWVSGRYVDQVQANGSVVRIWQPGHYEQQTVILN